ncbi:MAG: hypothetical protein JO069_16745 [Verrucomicrobia bacterium]|nr:hypothetical protein [Verrucomicrobiota bacterium]
MKSMVLHNMQQGEADHGARKYSKRSPGRPAKKRFQLMKEQSQLAKERAEIHVRHVRKESEANAGEYGSFPASPGWPRSPPAKNAGRQERVFMKPVNNELSGASGKFWRSSPGAVACINLADAPFRVSSNVTTPGPDHPCAPPFNRHERRTPAGFGANKKGRGNIGQ